MVPPTLVQYTEAPYVGRSVLAVVLASIPSLTSALLVENYLLGTRNATQKMGGIGAS